VRALVVAPTIADVDTIASPLIDAGADAVPCTVVDDGLRVLQDVRIDIVIAGIEMRDTAGRDIATLARIVEGPGLPPPVIGIRANGRARGFSDDGFDRVLMGGAVRSHIVRAVAGLLRARHN
jgi:hypothetical protein